ncbi:TspO/MBR family protein [Streptomyces sp. 891-h]|uniref:TspO/MBR family protein n=1 Tax=Streptomyces sp. 891-h TaxID=2720714 RepID=UPI001FAA72B2|nr:TspO/MBR family protein [Streptomyces sp. 891-h]UNZ18021.1 tryptophan-rich sensory protein [Streptomyces sp. 891-h]
MAELTGDDGREPTGQPRAGWPTLLLLLAVCYAVAAAGGFAAADSAETYQALTKPSWAPPGWIFGPVWTVLYGTIAVAAWLVLRSRTTGHVVAMTWWSVQLALNLAWTPLFFAADAYGLAFVDICLLLVALAGTVTAFGRRRRAAAVLLLPYMAWVAFAAALNLSIWLLNT